MMTILLIVVLIVFVVIVLSNTSLNAPIAIPYYGKPPLTPTETKFYHRLAEALPDYIILAQVQLSSFIGIDKKQVGNSFYNWFNRISQQSVDYLICRDDFSVVVAIELDDHYHNRPDAVRRDAKKTQSLKFAEVTLIRWHAESMPSVQEIRAKIVPATPAEPITDQEAMFLREDALRTVKPRRNPFPLLIGGLCLLILALYALHSMQNLGDEFTNLTHPPQPRAMPQGAISNPPPLQQMNQPLSVPRQPMAIPVQKPKPKQIEIATPYSEDEVALKEQLWNQYFKKSPECIENASVDCANQYIKAQTKFEQQWEAGVRDIKRFTH